MRRIFKSVSLVISFALAGALSVSPAKANGDTVTQAPTMLAPTNGSLVNPSFTLNYILPEAPQISSVRVTLTRTSPASPAYERTMVMSEATNVSLSINAFATPSEIITRSAGKINAIDPSTGILPVGIYTVRLSYQDASGNPANSVSSSDMTFTIPCAVGTYSTDGNVPVGSDCTQSPVNSYVATAGATAATACPATYTSPAGSDALSDCIAPVVSQTPTVVATPVTKALPTLAKGKKMKIKTLATQIEMSIPAKAKVTASVAKSSKKFCKVSGSSIKALKTGSCVVTVKVKPKKGATTTKATTITIN